MLLVATSNQSSVKIANPFLTLWKCNWLLSYRLGDIVCVYFKNIQSTYLQYTIIHTTWLSYYASIVQKSHYTIILQWCMIMVAWDTIMIKGSCHFGEMLFYHFIYNIICICDRMNRNEYILSILLQHHIFIDERMTLFCKR